MEVVKEIKKILFTDDDDDIRLIAKLSLGKVGKWEVVLCESGAEALDRARNEQPDVILLDIMMPDMDGLETFDALMADEETRAIPVIFITAKVQKQEVGNYLKRGVIGVIEKPFDPMTLADRVRDIINDYYSKLN